jgi:hypothetical protein
MSGFNHSEYQDENIVFTERFFNELMEVSLIINCIRYFNHKKMKFADHFSITCFQFQKISKCY